MSGLTEEHSININIADDAAAHTHSQASSINTDARPQLGCGLSIWSIADVIPAREYTVDDYNLVLPLLGAQSCHATIDIGSSEKNILQALLLELEGQYTHVPLAYDKIANYINLYYNQQVTLSIIETGERCTFVNFLAKLNIDRLKDVIRYTETLIDIIVDEIDNRGDARWNEDLASKLESQDNIQRDLCVTVISRVNMTHIIQYINMNMNIAITKKQKETFAYIAERLRRKSLRTLLVALKDELAIYQKEQARRANIRARDVIIQPCVII